MTGFIYRFRFREISETEISDLFFLASVAAKAVLGVNQADLEALVSRGKNRIPVTINAEGRNGAVLANVFLAFANEMLQPKDFQVVREPSSKRRRK